MNTHKIENILDFCFYFDKDNYNYENKNSYYLFWSNFHYNWIRTSETGKDILFMLDGNTCLSTIITKLCDEYNIPQEIIEKDAIQFCLEGLKRELIFKTKYDCHFPVKETGILELFLNITNYCNKECVYCYNNSIKNIDQSMFMSLSDVEKYLSHFFPNREALNTTIYLSGGEPLAHPEIIEILELVDSFKVGRIVIWTNGTYLTKELTQQLLRFNLSIYLSIDSAEEVINDQIRGKDSYKDAINAAKLCSLYSIDYVFTPTVTKYNLANIDKLLDLVEEYKAKGILINTRILEDINGNDLSDHFRCDKNMYVENINLLFKKASILISWRNTKSRKDNMIRVMTEREICLNSIVYIKNKENCGAGINRLNIDVNGNVYPCRVLHQEKYAMGSVVHLKNNLYDNLPNYLKKFDTCDTCKAQIFCLGGCKGDILSRIKLKEGTLDEYCTMKRTNTFINLWTPILLNESIEDTE